MAVERGIRLARTHLDEAMEALRAEQTTRGTAAGADNEMSPGEIRVDEATGLLERISLIDMTTGPYGYRGETERILRGRIDALRPEQTSDDGQPEGLTYRQEVEAGLTVKPNTDNEEIDGSQLIISLGLAGGRRAYDIPPYQLDQLKAIADGRPSWPNVERARGVEFDIDPLIDWLAEAVEKRLAEKTR